ncbi:AAA family ATPase [Methylobacterium sp. A54F]
MRLLSLNLERYGAFTDRVVAFRAEARLHVVLGPNEAGKSSALAAVTDLLFGIEARTRYAFRHDMPLMRIGAEIAAADGRRLAVRRRKGLRNTLVDAADAPLPEDALAPFLGGLTRDVFCRAFGLDARALRAGGEEMMDASGEVGASLLAASSGLRGYTGLQRDLETEAADIFMPRAAQHRTFYQALGRYDEARKAIRQGELRAGDWRDLNEEIEEAGRRLDAIRAERGRIARERTRLERLKRVAPLIAAIDAARERAEADAGLIEAGAGALARLGGGLADLEAAAAEAAQARAALAEAERELAAVPAADGLAAAADAILDAFRGIDRFEKDGTDLQRIQGAAEASAVELAHLARRVGLADADALRDRLPSDAARTRIEALIRRGREAEAARARLVRDRAARAEERARLAASQGEGPPIDPGPLRRDLQSFLGLRAEILRSEGLDAALRRATTLLALQGARLSPPVADMAALMRTGLPSVGAIQRFRQRAEGLERERVRAADRREAARRAVADREDGLRRREAGRPIPTRAELDALRVARDGLIARLGAREAADVPALARAVAAADQAADALVADAARAAEQAADLQRLAVERAAAEAVEAALADIVAEGEAADEAWRGAWAPAGIDPHPPGEMAAWRTEVEALVESGEGLETQRIEHAHASARIEAARAPLAELGLRAGLTDLPGLDAARLLERLEEHLADLTARWERAREVRLRLRAADEEIARLDAGLAEAAGEAARWGEAWQAGLRAFGLDGVAGLEEAEAALDAWRMVPASLREREDRLGRVAGMRRDMEAYRDAVATLCAAHAPELADLAPGAAMKALHVRLQAALGHETRRAELVRRRDAAARRHASAAQASAEAEAALAERLAELCPGAAPDPAVARALHGRLSARAALRAELAERRSELARAADGLAEDALRAELAETSAEAIEAVLSGFVLEEEDLDQRGKVAFADRDRGERRRVELEGGTGAELALAQRKAAEAELQGTARQWAVLRLAGLLLGSAVARHRAGQQDPLLTRAGGLFAGLTGGAFAGLAQDYDEADAARIAGRRASGELVPVTGLSEGTRDQLYLALRLAYLEDYAGRAEPAPFVGDDLFLTFDDARTAHGLEALAAVGERLQPILFTHHAHVAEIARARLGDAVDVVNL